MRRLLIANRAEIACRIMRTAQARGLECVAVYTDADTGSPHVAMADHALRIGTGPVGDSYLDADRILGAARDSGADALHPGYGFLSENADFAQAVTGAGLTWVGPPAGAIRAMGDKAAAKRLMRTAGVPCLPGYDGPDQSDATLLAEAASIGFPLMVKAVAGGGGRGMRLVADAAALPAALQAARQEAARSFGQDRLILERAVAAPRHVEVQVFADSHGNTIHMGERDCSVQRRHQKVIEEAPCPVLTPEQRAAMGATAIQAARAIGYCGAGTVEFLLDAQGHFHFLEMNTRLQVEHPVTEAVTGLDLVALQLDVAEGRPLGLAQSDIRLTGHAIEARLYAEDPARDFLPASGPLLGWHPPGGPGIRLDAGVVAGQRISAHYDPMMAKVIAHGPDRDTARRRLIAALTGTAVLGLPSNRDFLLALLETGEFARAEATTALIGDRFADGHASLATPRDRDTAARVYVAAAARRAAAQAAPIPPELMFWSSAGPAPVRVPFADGPVVVLPHAARAASDMPPHVLTREALHLVIGPRSLTFSLETHDTGTQDPGDGIDAPMTGALSAVHVAPGDRVARGDVLAVIEAMKMQHDLRAPRDGVVTGVAAAPGTQVTRGLRLITLHPRERTEDAAG